MLTIYTRLDTLRHAAVRSLTDRKGATAIEYGLIAAGIAVVIIGAVQLLGNNLTNMFNNVSNNV